MKLNLHSHLEGRLRPSTAAALAAEAGVTPGQLALAWVLAQGDDILPIPGTKHRKYIEENAAAVEINLSAEVVEALRAVFPLDAATGERYVPAMMALLNV